MKKRTEEQKVAGKKMGNRRVAGMSSHRRNSRKVEFDVTLPVMILKEGRQFVAYTPALDLCTCGDTFADAQEMFTEAVTVFLKELTKMGTIEEVLAECGWKRVSKPKPHWVPPRVVSQTEQTVRVSLGA